MKKGLSEVTWLLFVLLIIVSPMMMNDNVETASAAETPKYGGTMVVRHTLPTGMGYPAKSRSIADLDHSPICVDTLLRFGKDGKPEPWLATSWQYSADMKSLTLQGDSFIVDSTRLIDDSLVCFYKACYSHYRRC